MGDFTDYSHDRGRDHPFGFDAATEPSVVSIEPEVCGDTRLWRYGPVLAAAMDAHRTVMDECHSCNVTAGVGCWRHLDGPALAFEFPGYNGLRIEGDDGEMVDCGVSITLDCVGCGARGVGGTLVNGPKGMLASACEGCIARATERES